jgi:hypothetical protein
MKFLVTDPCIHSGGTHGGAGEVLTLSADEMAALGSAGRGRPVPDDYQSPAEIEAAAKAAAEAEALKAKAAEADEKAKAEAAAKATKTK